MTGLIRFLSRIFLLSVIFSRLRSDRRPTSRPSPPPADLPPPIKGVTAAGPPSGAGSSPDSPLDLDKGDWKATLKRTLKEIKADRITLVSAGMAFYFFLAIFPALIAFIGILGLVDVDSSEIVDSLRRNMPG